MTDAYDAPNVEAAGSTPARSAWRKKKRRLMYAMPFGMMKAYIGELTMKADVHVRWNEGDMPPKCIASVVILDCYFQEVGNTEDEARERLDKMVETAITHNEQEVKKHQERAIAFALWLAK